MIAELQQQREMMIAYLHLRADMEDWHGVMDAAADIREIDAKLAVLRELTEFKPPHDREARTKPGIYRHYKGGEYQVLGTARVSTNGPGEGKPVVVYVSCEDGKLYARDEDEFNDLATDPIAGVRRFVLVEET